MGWGGPWSSLLRRLVIPQDAGPSDPRIVIGTDDPLSAQFNDAGISWYWDDMRGFVTGVERSGEGPTAIGQWRLFGYVEGVGLSQFIDVSYDPTDPSGDGVAISGGSREDNSALLATIGPVTYIGGFSRSDQRLGNDARIYGMSMPRGLVPFTRTVNTSGSAVATPGTAESVLQVINGGIYRAGRAYRVNLRCLTNTASPCDLRLLVRKGSTTAGTAIVDNTRYEVGSVGDRRFEWFGDFRVTGNADVTTSLALCGFTSTGTVTLKGLTLSPYEVFVEDIGAASDLSGLPVLS